MAGKRSPFGRAIVYHGDMIAQHSVRRPTFAAGAGLLLAAPFLLLNAIVANRIQPFFSWIRPGVETSPQEYVLLFAAVLLLPAGAYVALRPMLRRDDRGQHRFHIVNSIAAMALLAFFVLLVSALGPEIYRCDVLHVPNCD